MVVPLERMRAFGKSTIVECILKINRPIKKMLGQCLRGVEDSRM